MGVATTARRPVATLATPTHPLKEFHDDLANPHRLRLPFRLRDHDVRRGPLSLGATP
jgi:hypothetical protein